MSFEKILIANRGDNRRAAQVASKVGHGAAEVDRRQHARRAQRVAIEPRHIHVP